MTALTRTWRTIRDAHAPLAWFAAAMIVVGAVSAVGYVADPRVLVGAPIWAKPLKFSVSFALYAVTLAWMISLLRRPRLQTLARRTGTVLAGASAVEMVAIVGQVIRGQQSHFNETTPFNAGVYAVMGATVVVISTCTVVVAVAVVMTPLADRAVTWALRLGLGISLAGMAVGFLMVIPRAAQLQGDSRIIGAHSVGTPDGGPAIPFLGWSTTGGDLRIAHFIGMHALQALPLLALALTLLPAIARLTARTRVQIVFLAAGTYAGVVALTLWQALRGQSILHPDRTTGVAVALLLVAAALELAAVARGARRHDTSSRSDRARSDVPRTRLDTAARTATP